MIIKMRMFLIKNCGCLRVRDALIIRLLELFELFGSKIRKGERVDDDFNSYRKSFHLQIYSFFSRKVSCYDKKEKRRKWVNVN